MPNTIASRVYRDKYRTASLEQVLRNALICEKICEVDRSDNKRIQNPYGSQPTATVQAIAGTYSVDTFTTTDDTLTVTDEVIVAEHIFDFEDLLTNFNMFAARTDEQNYSVAYKIDYFVLNSLCEDGTGAYTTPTGGFTTAANINVIMSNLISKVAGYADTYKGLFLVLENTDIVGFVQAQATNGFSFADAALKNGWMTNYMGVDIYVVRSGTFVTATIGTRSDIANDGHRVFGVKNVATYASPRGIKWEEKSVTGKTGMEVVTYGYVGFKLWTTKAALVVDITLA
ncbi:MAG: hypothetical protein UT51_C0011G0010 [Candidatus Nomurabacteria bacterium GW2011_GWC2_39_41]|uniref:Major capsid protein n=2 Tax=Parcubacteria group TaxID=1794811 RepID=A0A0G1RX47_9BACT|nr:MAG: hypothetical protein UT51_C0011G0010 [Candidatus Nomurabacteria bacterium GW2011_GWC2_39_41]KKU34563.1 MAG: hypothetical protein UX48_C0031G0011 [Candidatus Azambacteria bacterium GW2011_GWB1_46_27]